MHSPQWTVGDLTVHRVDETELAAPTGRWLMPDVSQDMVAEQQWLRPDFATAEGDLRLASQSFAVRIDGQNIVVDTGIGNHKKRANPAWHNLDTDYLARLSGAGFAPDSVDLVVLTHLHTDHVGWNTRRDGDSWVPTFPHARYLVNRVEWDYWAGVDKDEARTQMFRDSIDPIDEAGLFDLVDVSDAGYQPAPGLRLLPTPGHTPGHLTVELTSFDRRAVISGDAVHHPIQVSRPELITRADVDPESTVRTRRRLLAGLAADDALILGTHFPHPTGGRITARGEKFLFNPADEACRPVSL